jgi:transposase
MKDGKFKMICGIDWGSEKHDVCAMTPQREILFEREIAHEAGALHRLIDELIEHAGGDSGAVAVAIERPHGVIVETLIDRGVAVFAINPKKLDRFRDRHTVAGAKDDRRDAWVAAGALCTDPHVFVHVKPSAAEVVELREEGRIHDELRDQRLSTANRLREQLERYFPQFLKLGSVEEPWLWTLWEKAPTPEAARRLRRSAVEKILREHRIRRLNAMQVLEVLRAPGFFVMAATRDAAVHHINLLLPLIRLLDRQEKESTRRIESLVKRLVEENDAHDPSGAGHPKHSDAKIVLSLPGVGPLVFTAMLGEAGTAIEQRNLTMLRTHSGEAPVTKRSGKSLVVIRRRACNGRLCNAVRHMAFSAINCDERSRQHYDALRARGHAHERALRGIADRLLNVLIAMLESGTLYDAKLRNKHPQLAA